MRKNISDIEYELIDTSYVNSGKKLNTQNEKGYYYLILYHSLKVEYIPNFVDKDNLYSIQNIRLWCEVKKPFKLLSNTYI